MAFRLGRYVVYGEMRNRHYTTFGVLIFRGREDHPLYFELTGRPNADLIDKTIRFTAKPTPDDASEEDTKAATRGMNMLQNGVTGEMTADAWCRVFDIPATEAYDLIKAGNRPPSRWVRKLHFEWFGPNGGMDLELADPEIEVEVAEDDWRPHPIATLPPYHLDRPAEELDAAAILQIEKITDDGKIEQLTFIDGEQSDPTELMDVLIEKGETEPIASLFGEPRVLPSPDDLSEEQGEAILKSILCELALRGVAVHVCEHFTPKEAYRLLVERILHENEVYPEATGSGWIQNFMTSEYCDECLAKMEEGLDSEESAGENDFPEEEGEADFEGERGLD